MIFEVTVLGSGAALPTLKRNPSAQYVNCNERHILIDCGEGTQNQIRRFGIKIQKIKHILISHLHGDHYFGLIGLLSTMNLLGRTEGLTIYGPPELEEILHIQFKASGHYLAFKLKFQATNSEKLKLIFEDKLIEIHSIPLKHRIKTTGFIIKEKIKERAILGEEFKKSKLSLAALPFFKRGENFITENGEEIDFEDFSLPAKDAKSFAYFSDTAVLNENSKHIEGINALYHEATFTDEHTDRAEHTFHSTASQAAEFAKFSNVKKLYLGHISSRYENTDQHFLEAKIHFDNTIIVEDGMKFVV
ncbi:MAG: ribonuclease Z [Bacteroidota bacterium]